MPILKRPLPKANKAVPAKAVRRSLPKVVGSKSTTPVKSTTPKAPVERDEYGITVGTDQSIILAEMIKGGKDKHEITERCNAIFAGKTTQGGKPKPTSTVVNQLIRTMGERGFVVESSWRIVPPADGVVIPPRKRSVSKTKAAAKKSSPSTKDKPATARRRLPNVNKGKAST